MNYRRSAVLDAWSEGDEAVLLLPSEHAKLLSPLATAVWSLLPGPDATGLSDVFIGDELVRQFGTIDDVDVALENLLSEMVREGLIEPAGTHADSVRGRATQTKEHRP